MDTPDNFVSKLVEDPQAQPPALRLLRGYVGASALDEHIRLYLSAELDAWVEIPASALRLRQLDGSDPLGAEFVWVARDAQLAPGQRSDPERRAAFLGE